MSFTEFLGVVFGGAPLAGMLLAGLIGLMVAWFSNLFSEKFPDFLASGWRGLTQPPARLDLVPFVGFFFGRMKLRTMSGETDTRPTIAEIAAFMLSALLVLRFFDPRFAGTLEPELHQVIASLLLSWMILVAITIEVEHLVLPDFITTPLTWIGLVFAALNLGLLDPVTLFQGTAAEVTLSRAGQAILGYIVGYALLWGIIQLLFIGSGSSNMGKGHVKLMAAGGAWLGPFVVGDLLLLSTAMLGIYTGIRRLTLPKTARRRGMGSNIPYGPFLALAIWVVMVVNFPLLKLVVPQANL